MGLALCLFQVNHANADMAMNAATAQSSVVAASSRVVAATSMAIEATAADVEIGRRIYVEGKLPSGEPLKGTRFGTTPVSGVAAACVSCHRPSGMGQVEGDIVVPPITGKYLYAKRGDKILAVMDPRVSKLFNQKHDPYNDTSLAEAIVRGKNNSGIEMVNAMPRYDLSASDLKYLTLYLNQLSAQWSAGVSNTRIRFATVITPDVDATRRQSLITMVQGIVHQKNGSTETASSTHGRHHMTSAAEMMLGTERNWDLDIWELNGAPETWGDQLAAFYKKQPVFALISGLAGSTWQPVHDFCDKERVPCWFPTVSLPSKSQSPYAFYFSSGVLLEADVLARHLSNEKVQPKHLVQISRDEVVGRSAAQELTQMLGGSRIKVETRVLDSNLPVADALHKSLSSIKSGDAVVLWLGEGDAATLSKLKPASHVNYYFSVTMAKSTVNTISSAWKKSAHLIYLYELPEKRLANLNYFNAWMNLHKFPVIDEAMQSEVFFSFNYLTDTISEMLDNLYRDYLIERAETMINKREGSKAEQETRDRLFLGNSGELIKKHGEYTVDSNVRIPIPKKAEATDKSFGTTLYPNLSLGPEQRFASKGGYVVRYDGKQKDKLVDESGWIVP